MGDVFGAYSWTVRTYECAADGAATMASVCNWLQEAASLNAETLAFSKSNFESAGENISWVLTRLKVKMSRFPKWGETVSILTFPRGGRRIVAWRDFVLTGADGEELGRATSEWMIIDLASRKIVAIPEGVFAAANTVRPPVFGDEPFAKLRWGCTVASPDALVFRARRGDIDLNGHVNNVHYVEWLLEGRPDTAGPCFELDVVFKSETLAGEEVRVESVEPEPGVFMHRIYAPDGRDHVLARTAPRSAIGAGQGMVSVPTQEAPLPTQEEIKAFKGKGWLLNKGTGTFSARVVTVNGKVSADQLRGVAEAARKFGTGEVTFTSRLGIEVLGVPAGRMAEFEAALSSVGLSVGGTGPRVRPVTSCKGTVCPRGLIDTFSLSRRIHERFYVGWHGVALPGKFKIGVGGCPNNCVKPNLNDIGVAGTVLPGGRRGYQVTLGGHWGRTGGAGTVVPTIFGSEDEVLDFIDRVLCFYRDNGQPGERFFKTLDRIGFNAALAMIG